MKWRVLLELVGADGAAAVHEVSGGAAVAEYTPRMIGLSCRLPENLAHLGGPRRARR
jgi:hypothetical protein